MAKSKQVVPPAQVKASSSSSKQATKPKAASTPNTNTSIDDIFAKPAAPSAKAAGKAKATTEGTAPVKKVKSSVETVMDPSASSSVQVEKPKKRDRAELDEQEAFRDSRGDGPRRRTEEGYAIFKEAELKIDPTAGGTPLCPFDCDCCF